ncbi:MAG: CRISPR-associated protein Cas7 [Rikenellaceae bacterium]
MNTIYIRTLKKAEHTVFCVADGQKYYIDPQFSYRRVPYSSGQQVKRSILDALSNNLNQIPSPTTFVFEVTKKGEIGEGEVYATCNPIYADQLIGGWMKATKGGTSRTLKRRSPISISAMRGLHPLLAGVTTENASFDRSDRFNNEVIVRNEKGNVLTEDQISDLLQGKDRSLSRKWIPNNSRATGLFVQDIAIDLRRLFTVSLSKLEPEISVEVEQTLRDKGWKEIDTVFGKSLLAPKVMRNDLIQALASSIINWNITSNQSRTFSLMETLAVTISDNANKIAGSIRAKLKEDEEDKVEPIIEENMAGVDTFITLAAGGSIRTRSESVDALDNATAHLISLLQEFDYEDQLSAKLF